MLDYWIALKLVLKTNTIFVLGTFIKIEI